MPKKHICKLTLTVNGVDVVVGEIAINADVGDARAVRANVLRWVTGDMVHDDLRHYLFDTPKTMALFDRALEGEIPVPPTKADTALDTKAAAPAPSKAESADTDVPDTKPGDPADFVPEGWLDLSWQAKVKAIGEMDEATLFAVDTYESQSGEVAPKIAEAIGVRRFHLA